MAAIQELINKVKAEIAKVVIGQDEVIEGILMALFLGGHVLLEGPPGLAKTLIVKTISKAVAADYKRIQFTPDLMPLDITGTNIFDFQKQQFTFKPGPIFTDLLLADEINRTPPKTQSALLEAMEEKQLTIDGVLHPLSPIFTVIATQNPIEYEGTYPLPEAQLDRFLVKLLITYPNSKTEIGIFERYQTCLVGETDLQQIQPVLSKLLILEIRQSIAAVQIRSELFNYVNQIIKATRESPFLSLGASPRAGVYLIHMAKAKAFLEGRDYLIPDDLQEAAFPVLRHRLLVKPEAQIDGRSSDMVIKHLLATIAVPR